MFNIKLIAILFISFNFIYAQQQPLISTEQMNLKGKVRSMQISEYEAKEKNGEILRNGKIIPVRYIAFDINGNIEEQNIYNKDSSLRVKITYEYEKGKLQEKNIYNKDASLKAKIRYMYNDKGLLSKIVKIVNHRQILTTTNTYNNKNQIIEQYCSNDQGMVFKEVYTYDKQGNKIAVEYFNNKNILYKKATFTYDQNNQLLMSTLKSEPSVNTNFGATRVFDRAGQQSKYHHHHQEYVDSEKIYTYNEKGQTMSMQDHESEKLYTKSTYFYDAEGNQIKEISYFYEDDLISNIVVKKIEISYYY